MSVMSKRKKLVMVAGAVGVIVLAGLFFARDKEAATAPAASAVPQVVELAAMEVTQVKRQDLTSEVRVSGSIQPLKRTSMTAKVAGTISDVLVDVGDNVKQGDVLARFDTVDFTNQLDERRAGFAATKAQLDVAETTLARASKLSDSGISSRATLDQAQADVLRLRAQLKGLESQVQMAEKALRDAVVQAEFDGTVSARNFEAGQTVGVNAELFGIVDLSVLEVSAGVPSNRIYDITIGQAAELRVDGLRDRTFKAEVRRISPVAVTNSRSITVFLSLDNADRTLRGGMFATGAIRVRDAADVVALPPTALRKDGDRQFVLKVEHDRLVRQDVTAGETWQNGRLVEISSGVEEGDIVVTAPLPDLKPDTTIRIAGL